MPWLHVQTNAVADSGRRHQFLQEAITILATKLSKPEKVFMGAVEAKESMIFGGDAGPAAMIHFAALDLPQDRTDELAQVLCGLATEHLKVPGERIFVRFENTERHMWGCNGKTFA